ncbi:hypothetical protein IVB45_18525 [Bradyrhizobium sp. 4]|uniref:hypothetical protein n=1 Tax=unclassified Bradyrhizobium TaxID=2631580 RepID=UPI001FF90691|nr:MULTISPECIES: hypothetical protein [unclassified Bradyrhizobium]MCK1400118.1 hypothetical protein [Bradyrhizobium sp. 39]MCK1750408.1 hypothetical protein [Bradyrhizobium sp. 135]UPJ32017.1 hypothetical protein IVB45_18525 [Bradyrhizobium sp. 4]
MKYEIALGALLASALWIVVAITAGAPTIQALKDFAGPIATVFAASVAGWVAFTLGRAQVAVAERAWQTSNEKIVLDLFDKRLSIIEDVRSLIGEVVRNGRAPDEHYYRWLRATDRVSYFFGPEVEAYIERLRQSLIKLEHANSMLETHVERPIWAEVRRRHFEAVVDFYKEAPPIFAPYMKAHQKA